MKYFTRRNFTNYRWWIGLVIFTLTLMIILPFSVFYIVFGLISDCIDTSYDFMDKFLSKQWRSFGKWIREGNRDE